MLSHIVVPFDHTSLSTESHKSMEWPESSLHFLKDINSQ